MKPSKSHQIVVLSLALLVLCGSAGGSYSSPAADAPPNMAVTASPARITVVAGARHRFTAGNASVGVVSASRLYPAPSSAHSPNPVQINATTQADASKSASTTVRILHLSGALASLNPIVAMQSSAGLVLAVHGSGFTSGTHVLFNGVAFPTTFVSSSEVTAYLSAGSLSEPGPFPISVETNGTETPALDFYVVPNISSHEVAVAAASDTSSVDIGVRQFDSPSLSLLEVGAGNVASAGGAAVEAGSAATLLLAGTSLVPGTMYMVSGDAGDVTVTQPLVENFTQTTDGKTTVNLNITVKPSAAPGPRNILVTNPAGEVAVFVGGLLVVRGN